MAHQVQGSETILSMLLTDHEIRLVLVDREMNTEELRHECERQGIPLEEGSTNDLWRMSATGNTDALALIGREPHGTLEEVFERGGSIWLLDGVQYPTISDLESEPSKSVVGMQWFSTSRERTKIGGPFVAQACVQIGSYQSFPALQHPSST